MKSCLILGGNSDIAKALMPMLAKDYELSTWSRDQELPYALWDLCIIAIGKVAPVGMWHEQGHEKWDENIRSNLLLPAKLLRRVWSQHKPDARVCWFAGSNPNAIMAGYSAYNTAKMAVLKLVEQIDAEYADVVVFALGPGVTDTKIHDATKAEKWPNLRLERALKDGSFTPVESIFKTLMWCISQPKSVVGGRNICVSDLKGLYTPGFLEKSLLQNDDLFKLKRDEHMGGYGG